MTGIYDANSSTSGGIYSSPAVKSRGNILDNLLSDIRTAAVGLPAGVVQLAEHPIRSVEVGAKSTWQDWSPLFHGHVGQWWHNTYAHPLAPLLDLTTAFSGGASLGARVGAKLGEIGAIDSSSALAKLGKLAEPKVRALNDPLASDTIAARPVMGKALSNSPAARLRQEATYALTNHLSSHLPSWVGDNLTGPGASYERAYSKFLSRRGAALGQIQYDTGKAAAGHAHIAEALSKMTADQIKTQPQWAQAAHTQIAAALHAGKALSEVDTRKVVEPALLKYNYENFARHGIPHGDLTVGEHAPLPTAYGYVLGRTHAEQHFVFKPGTPFEQQMENFGRTFMTNDAKKAARDGNGKLLIAPTKAAYALGKEGARSSTFLKKLWASPSSIWKKAVVGYSPRTVVDNAIGNWTMLAMRQGGHKMLPGIADTVRQIKGARASKQLLGAAGLSGHWTNTHFLDELNAGLGHSLADPITAKSKLGKVAQNGFYPLVHSVADQPVRRVALNSFMRSAPEVKALMKRGHGYDAAVTQALKSTPNLQFRAAEHIRSIAGDYTGLTQTEKAVRSIIPFYAWDRHIATHTASMLAEHPGRLAAAQQVSDQGVNDTTKKLGALPSFLEGLLPLGGTGHDGRVPVLNTQGLNPYSTVPDIAGAVSSLLAHGKLNPGETIGGQINPLLSGLVEQLSGTKMGSTQPIATHGGLIPSIVTNAAESIPYAKLIASLTGHGQGSTYTSKGKTQPHLYAGDPSQFISQVLGAPVKRLSTSAAARLAKAEQPKVKKKKVAAGLYG